MKKFLQGFLALILILVIAGGIGYIGYNYLSSISSNNSMAGHGSAYSNEYKSSSTTQSTQNSHSNMQKGTVSIDSMTTTMANKESLDKAILSLKKSIAYMTLDPYAPNVVISQQPSDTGASNNMGSMPNMQSNASSSGTDANATSTTEPQASSSSMIMTNMGTRYNADKMEQLHKGIYKLSVGMLLLDNIGKEFTSQAEYAAINMDNQLQHYISQYNMTLQNKNKLNQAINYVNEAANLVNINPYVDQNGLVYDKERMKSIHESIVSMAEGVATLNILNDELTKQSVNTSVKVQNIMNALNTSTAPSTAPDVASHSTPSGVFGNAFSSINIPAVINITLILFVVLFILGLLGFVFSLLKPKQQPIQ